MRDTRRVAARVALATDIGEGLGAGASVTTRRCSRSSQRQHRLRLPRRRPGDHAPHLRDSVANGVAIGAQVSYRDLHGFGRRYIAVPGPELTDDLLYQLGALEVFARLAGGKVDYVRAHGALYNVAAKDTEHAQALVDATVQFDKRPAAALPGRHRGVAAGRGGGAPAGLGGVRRPGLHRRGAAPAAHRARRAAARRRRGGRPRGPDGHRGPRHRRRRQRGRGQAEALTCTPTPRARSRSRAGRGRPWRRPGVELVPCGDGR